MPLVPVVVLSPRKSPVRSSLIAVLLLALASGCAAVDREGRADEVTESIESLPGVEDVYGDYVNSISLGASYSLRVGLTDDATEAQAAEVARVWTDLVGRDGLSGHDLELHLHTPDREDNLTMSAQDGGPVDPTDSVPVWFRLKDTLPEELSLKIENGVRTASLTSSDVEATVESVRAVADLPDVRWSVTVPSGVIVRFAGPVPDQATTQWLGTLAEDADMWHVDLDPAAEAPIVTRTFLLEENGAWSEAVARRHLDLVAALGQPVTHTEAVPDAEDLVVEVGGCRSGSAPLEQQLNRDYGTC